MTQPDYPTDEDLVAYLDSETTAAERARIAETVAAHPRVQARLALLARGAGVFQEAIDPVLAQAPRVRLEAMLTGLPGYRTAPIRPGRMTRRWSYIAAMAAAIALFLAGIAMDRISPLVRHLGDVLVAENQSAGNEWRQAVAEYLTLYTAETLASIPEDADMRRRELATVGARLGIALTPAHVALPELSLRRAQLFQYDKTPLGQIAYLDQHDGPVALCIFAESGADAAPRTEQREGLNIVYWSANGRAFMLVGHGALSKLQNFAGTLSVRLSS